MSTKSNQIIGPVLLLAILAGVGYDFFHALSPPTPTPPMTAAQKVIAAKAAASDAETAAGSDCDPASPTCDYVRPICHTTYNGSTECITAWPDKTIVCLTATSLAWPFNHYKKCWTRVTG